MIAARAFRRTLSGAVIALIALTLSAGSVLADTELGHTGKVGSHMLIDTKPQVGAKCSYSGGRITSIWVRGPLMYARDKTGGVDEQQVGWKFTVQRRGTSSKPWKPFLVSSVQTATATDFTPASVTNRSLPIDPPAGDYFTTGYRVFVTLYWYTNGEVSGVAKHRIDWYRVGWPNWFEGGPYKDGPGGECTAVYGYY